MSSSQVSSLRRKVLLGMGFGIVVIASFSLVADASALSRALTNYDYRFFAAGVALATLNYVLRFWRWQGYLHAVGITRVPRFRSALIFTAGFVMSITPGKVGEVLKSWLLKESDDVAIEATAPIVVAERLTDLMALVILAALGSLTVKQGYLVALAGLAFVVVLWLVLASRRVSKAVIRMIASIPRFESLASRLENASQSMNALIAPRPLLVATTIATASWFLECASLWVIVRGFASSELSWLQATFAYSAPTIVGALAMMPGGLGVTEAGMTGLLEEFASLSRANAILGTLLVRFATLWWAVILGIFAWAIHVLTEARRQK